MNIGTNKQSVLCKVTHISLSVSTLGLFSFHKWPIWLKHIILAYQIRILLVRSIDTDLLIHILQQAVDIIKGVTIFCQSTKNW